MAGIQETKELVAAFTAIADATMSALQDGKFDLGDIRYAPELIWAFNQAIDGMTSVPEEIKDLSLEETQELLGDLAEVFFKMAQTYKVVREAFNK